MPVRIKRPQEPGRAPPPPPLFADVVEKGVFGILICAIASVKLTVEEDDLDRSVRWFWWSVATIPLCYVLLMLIVGLNEETSKQPPLAATRLGSA